MFKNYLKVALRSLMKRKGFTLINIFGLATGMAVCLLILLFIRHELSYDDFEANGDRVYRVVLDRKYPGRSTRYAIIPSSIGTAMQKEFPEVEVSTGLQDLSGNVDFFARIGDRSFDVRGVYSADSNFFRVFPLRLLEGDTASALRKPNMAVINERTAIRFWGSASAAIGKVFKQDGTRPFEISGVCADWPDNSHLTFNILLSLSTFKPDPNYTGFSTYTYLLLRPHVSPAALESKFPQIVQKYVAGAIGRSFAMSFEQFTAAGNGYLYYLQPLQRIHLISDLEAEIRPNGSERAVLIFGIIAVFILGIACINFINLSTARSLERAREVGIRKTFGSERGPLILQFLLESVLVSMLSVLVAAGLVLASLPFFSRLSGEVFTPGTVLSFGAVLGLLGFGVLVGVVAGLYPAFVLASFQPIKVLKGKFQTSRYGNALRNGLVVFQFAISIILLVCTLVVHRQMDFVLGDQLGFRKDHVIEVERADLLNEHAQAFINQTAGLAGVEKVSGASALPGDNNFQGIAWRPVGSTESMIGRGIFVDDQYAATLGLTIKEGRFFSKAYARDSLSVVLNEKAVKAMGLKEPVVGTRLNTTEDFLNPRADSFYSYTVIGVVKDFHFHSLHQSIDPLVISNITKVGNRAPLTAIRISGDNFQSAIGGIGELWRQFVPDRPFRYTFLDEQLAGQYKTEQTLQRIFTVFSVLAILIACIGLLGLAVYATQQRMREMSIRKVLGAGAGTIVGLLSKDFIRLVSLSAFVAFPVAWLAMHSWLQGFAYRVSLSWWTFVLAWLVCLGITLITISFQALRAAAVNPVKILRSE